MLARLLNPFYWTRLAASQQMFALEFWEWALQRHEELFSVRFWMELAISHDATIQEMKGIFLRLEKLFADLDATLARLEKIDRQAIERAHQDALKIETELEQIAKIEEQKEC